MFVCSLSNLSLFRWLCKCVHSAQDPLTAYQPLPPNTQDEQTWFEKLCWRNLSGSHRNLRLTFKKDCKVEWKIAVWNNQSTLLARTCWHHNDKQQRVSTQSSTAKLQQNGYKWKSTSVIGGFLLLRNLCQWIEEIGKGGTLNLLGDEDLLLRMCRVEDRARKREVSVVQLPAAWQEALH